MPRSAPLPLPVPSRRRVHRPAVRGPFEPLDFGGRPVRGHGLLRAGAQRARRDGRHVRVGLRAGVPRGQHRPRPFRKHRLRGPSHGRSHGVRVHDQRRPAVFQEVDRAGSRRLRFALLNGNYCYYRNVRETI